MNKKRLIVLGALVLWILFIFGHSLQPGAVSTQASDGVRQVLAGLSPHEFSSGFVRKTAHFAEFWVLGALAACFFAADARRPLPAFFYSAVLSLTTALCDETIQLFVAGRNGRIPDVWLDFAGALTGAAAVLALLYLVRRYGWFARSHRSPGSSA